MTEHWCHETFETHGETWKREGQSKGPTKRNVWLLCDRKKTLKKTAQCFHEAGDMTHDHINIVYAFYKWTQLVQPPTY